MISNLDHVNEVIGVEHLANSLLPAIVHLSKDPKWRVRLAIIQYMPLLADQLGVAFFSVDQLTLLCLTWLVDQVYAIREAAVENLARLAKKFGSSWTQETILPKVLALSRHGNYLYRMICLQSIISLSGVLDAELCQNHLLPTALAMHNDGVPNVRFKVSAKLV
ncbi:unnamed protein product [Protopolystoma xenopodis]|uniref:Condensin complex subunit 1 C-terminal domain-containing protein n=1 Tax=Protopolystoma xenopodis TaxID=117903 RepID=A0A3S4ZZC7_9PLAT|nr:unnamed protein product [Protopolystoma xenopodis]